MHGSAHEVLARIALLRRESADARQHAAAATSAEPGRPVDRYVEGRLLYDAGRYADALTHFEEALAEFGPDAAPIADLSFHAGDVLVRLQRFEDAERRLLDELDGFPQHARSWTALANLYHATGRADEAAQTVSEFVRVAPTPETFSTAARLLTTFGRLDQAAAIRAEAGRRFAGDPQAEGRAQQ
jgi:tetratricopeptide (TPR) repeat protein